MVGRSGEPGFPAGAARTLVLALLAVSFAGAAQEVSAQAVLSASPDVTIAQGAGAVFTEDHVVTVDNQLGVIVPVPLGTFAEEVDVVGFAEAANGRRLYTIDTTVLSSHGFLVTPGDVVAVQGTLSWIAFDADAAGLPRGVATDAVSTGFDGDLLLSFDTDVTLPGPLHVADEDLVRWDGSSFSLALDGSAVGMSRALDVDAVDDRGPTAFLVSFDTGGSVGGVTFADEDILRFQNGSWSLERDSSLADADWRVADLDAMQVPEPGFGIGLLLGCAGFAALGTGRANRRRVGGRSIAVRAALVFAGCTGLAASAARAELGMLEIDQSCATTGGCFQGDASGFPVTIAASGSYRLVGNLTPPNELVDVLVVNASGVRIDLNGFAIVGPVVCSGIPLACTPAGTGSGVEASAARTDVRVENGSITGMGIGISLNGTGSHVERVRVGSNRLGGISVGPGARVAESVVFRNGGVGVSAGRGSSVTRSVLSRNGSTGLELFQTAATGGFVASDNSLHDNQGSGITSYAGSSVLSRNTVYSNGIHGISANGGAQVSGNTVVSNTDRGLDLGPSDSGYTENVMVLNGTDAVGGLSLGGNSCGGTSSCP